MGGLPETNNSWSIEDFRLLLETYSGITMLFLRGNLVDFLSEVAQQIGVHMNCHPDDPPVSLLGLSRVMSTNNETQLWIQLTYLLTVYSYALDSWVLHRVMMGLLIHFVHLRNTKRIIGSLSDILFFLTSSFRVKYRNVSNSPRPNSRAETIMCFRAS